MQIEDIPEVFQSRIRLSALTALMSGEKSFTELKELTGATDGNLGSHLLRLEQENYLVVEKKFVKRRPKSTYQITEKGRNELLSYVDQLMKEVYRAR